MALMVSDLVSGLCVENKRKAKFRKRSFTLQLLLLLNLTTRFSKHENRTFPVLAVKRAGFHPCWLSTLLKHLHIFLTKKNKTILKRANAVALQLGSNKRLQDQRMSRHDSLYITTRSISCTTTGLSISCNL